MKKIFMLLLAVSAFAFTGCSDDDDDNDYGIIPPAGTSLVSKITISTDDYKKNIMTFSYDSKNRISQVLKENIWYSNGIAEDGGETKITLKYANENTINISGEGKYWYEDATRSVNPNRKDKISSRAQVIDETITITGSITLNSNKYITSGETVEKSKYWDEEDGKYYNDRINSNWTANYSGSEIKSSKYTYTAIYEDDDDDDDDTYTYEYNYSWGNDKLTDIKRVSQPEGIELTYGNTPNNEKINLDLNWIYNIEDLLQDDLGIFNLMGYYGVRSDKMIEKINYYGFDAIYSYILDTNDRIKEIKIDSEYLSKININITYK